MESIKRLQVTLDNSLSEEVNAAVKNGYVYSSKSHFIRCAIIEKLRKKI